MAAAKSLCRYAWRACKTACLGPLFAITVCLSVAHAQTFLTEIKAEHDPGRRSQKALLYADQSFDSARLSYKEGEVHKGDAALEDMTTALTACVNALSASHKSRFYKQAELNVAALQRRMDSLLQSLDPDDRGWAEQTSRKLEEVHEIMLGGAMRK